MKEEPMQTLAMPASRYIFGTLPWYSVTMVSAIVAAILLALREEKRRGLPKDTVIDLALWLIPCGIVGARLYYVAFTWDLFRSRPLAILEIWKGGLAIYGAIIAGVLAAFVFARRRKLPLFTLVDMVVPGLALAQCIGRWGNYFNMEAYGLPITNPAWQFFPAGVLILENGQPVWHMATFFYESLWDLGVFIALQSLRKHCRRPGDLTCWYAVLYGAGRLIVEGLRMDSLMAADGSARISQLISVAGCLAAFVLLCAYALRRASRGAWLAGLGTGLAAGILAWLLPAPAEAFYGYHLAFSLKAGLMLGGFAALAVSRRSRRVMTCVPALLALCLELVCYVHWQGSAASAGISTALCALFSLCAITACAGVYPFAMLPAAPVEKVPAT